MCWGGGFGAKVYETGSTPVQQPEVNLTPEKIKRAICNRVASFEDYDS